MDNNTATAICCDNLSKNYYLIDEGLNWRVVFRQPKQSIKPFEALKNINLTVPKGSFLGVLGKNGAGKSTLLRVLGGVFPPSSGIVKVTGSISGLFEMGGIGNRQITGEAYAERFLSIYGVKKSERKKHINNIQKFSDIGDAFTKPIYTYSSGMAARLFFSAATELEHDIYLVDELLSVGDAYFQAKCWRRLRERFLKGASGILVTHDWAAVIKLCKHAAILDKGKIILEGPSDKIVQSYLNLPKLESEYANIIVPDSYTAISQKNFELKFDVALRKKLVLAVSYSIDIFYPGFGWEVILHQDAKTDFQGHVGRNTIKINFETLPLAPGDYHLNLFVIIKDGSSANIIGRSWTHGNGIPFKVIGVPKKSVTVLPWKVKIAK